MAPSSRLAVRFAQLPHDALAELAAQLCADGGATAAADKVKLLVEEESRVALDYEQGEIVE